MKNVETETPEEFDQLMALMQPSATAALTPPLQAAFNAPTKPISR